MKPLLLNKLLLFLICLFLLNSCSSIKLDKKKIKDISSASPKARKFARELGVNINQVVGSEKNGRVIPRISPATVR